MNSRLGTILIIDDVESFRSTLARTLELANYRVVTCGEHTSGLRLLEMHTVDAILLDLQIPGVKGFEALEAIRAAHPLLPVIMITAFGNIPTAVQATKLGAFDFLEKRADRERLLLVVRNACERSRLEAERLVLLRSVHERTRMVGESQAIKDLLRLVERVAPTENSVLIVGETGTGKELVADAIQGSSRRAARPFVRMNCAAIPKDLIESKLFGHRKGAFTDAKEDRAGAFKLADTGTLFLDEIADMDLAAQAKVLRALQEGEIEPVGGKGQENVDVRVIAATNKNLDEMAKAGRFREDLHYRIKKFIVPVPPLRERIDDIKPLTEYFLAEGANKNNRPLLCLHSDALRLLVQYSWPGNIRELQNCADWLETFATYPEITVHDVNSWLGGNATAEIPTPEAGTFVKARQNFERDYFAQLLKVYEGNVSAVARAADLDRSGLYRKLKSLDPAVDVRPH